MKGLVLVGHHIVDNRGILAAVGWDSTLPPASTTLLLLLLPSPSLPGLLMSLLRISPLEPSLGTPQPSCLSL